MNRETLVVTGAIIKAGNKVLVARRHPTSRFEPGKWEFPGGKLEFGEDPKTAVVREIQEELGIDITVECLYDVRSHLYFDALGERHVVLVFFLCRVAGGEPRAIDCSEFAFATRQELVELPFVEGDIGVRESIVSDDSVWISS